MDGQLQDLQKLRGGVERGEQSGVAAMQHKECTNLTETLGLILEINFVLSKGIHGNYFGFSKSVNGVAY